MNRTAIRHTSFAAIFFSIALCLILAPMPGNHAAAAEEHRPPAERGVRLTLPINNQPVTGSIDRFDDFTFTLKTDQGDEHRILWNAIPADNVDRYWRHMLKPEDDAEALLELGDLLVRHPEGKDLAERAFEQALKLDPTLADAVDQARQGRSPDGSPRYVGVADPKRWGELSDETMQQGVHTLLAFCEKTNRELGMQLKVHPTKRFILLTDVDDDAAVAMSANLEKAYRETAKLLGDDPDANVFYGKCLVVLFAKRVDYIRFQRELHDTDARGTGGMCHGFGDGHAHVAAIQRTTQRQTNHVVAHELVHAYLHRYRTPVKIDDWLNEGLAEHLAHVVEPPPKGENLYLKARLLLEGKQGLGEDFYETDTLAPWQYDVAGALTAYLLERSEDAYPKLIQQIKDGQPTAEALKSIYRMEPRTLTSRFKRRLDRELGDKLGL